MHLFLKGSEYYRNQYYSCVGGKELKWAVIYPRMAWNRDIKLSLLLPPPKCWDYRCLLHCSIFCAAGTELKPLCMVDKQSAV